MAAEDNVRSAAGGAPCRASPGNLCIHGGRHAEIRVRVALMFQVDLTNGRILDPMKKMLTDISEIDRGLVLHLPESRVKVAVPQRAGCRGLLQSNFGLPRLNVWGIRF